MIANILLLLAANIMLPLLPVPPQILLTYPLYEYYNAQPTIYNDMVLERHYNPDELKKSFRESLKKFHPDRGGTAQHFAMIKAAKQIMQQKPNYYDLYNLTIVDLKRHQNIVQAADMKKLLFQFQTLLFYFIALLYFIAFTIDDRFRGLRKILIPLTVLSCAYELYIHTYPQTFTIFDFVDGQIPLFVQSQFIKIIFAVFTAVLRARKTKSKDEELVLLQEIQNLPPIQEYQLKNQAQKDNNNQSVQNQTSNKNLYLTKLKRLLEIYIHKVKKQEQNEKSWATKIKNWISKGVSFAIIGLMIWGFIGSNAGSGESYAPNKNQF